MSFGMSEKGCGCFNRAAKESKEAATAESYVVSQEEIDNMVKEATTIPIVESKPDVIPAVSPAENATVNVNIQSNNNSPESKVDAQPPALSPEQIIPTIPVDESELV